MKLSEFVSNDRTVEEISYAADNGTLPHAILIEGAPGTGKRTLADIISRAAVCTADHEKPCETCPDCLKALHGNHPDIFTADGNNSGELSVDAIRRIRTDAYIKPNEAAKKAYILNGCDKMLTQAQNAFLKILEEPPANVIFIMTVTSANMLLPTVRSRARLYSLYPADPGAAAAYVSRMLPDMPYEAVAECAVQCVGNIGKTIETLQSGGEESAKLAEDIIRAAFKSSEYDLLVLTSKLCRDRFFAVRTLDNLVELSSQCVKASVGAAVSSELASDISKRISKRRLLLLTDNISRARKIISTNVNLNFFGTWLSSVLKV